ncbi:aldo/keto reductase [Scheffersomyces xylosifermentans]|uniref:aldo/keto reductase n=1 Tax=Scheffersomyces xylosifermentans TaxID=1304137 RepID=UPI00315CC63E
MATTYKSTKIFKLNNGETIPAVGLGTWQASADDVYKAVIFALKTGYRHIDSALAYGNEKPVGRAIRDSGIPRKEIFVTTKLAPIDALDPVGALDQSLKNLGLDYVDLYLMHWPVCLNKANKSHPGIPTLPNGKRDIVFDRDFTQTYADMQKLVEAGKAKSIGVSNFSIKNLKKLFSSPDYKITPTTNQVEIHPYLPQTDLLKFCREHDILLEAFSPLGSSNSPLLKDETILKIAEKNKVSPATILISWAVWRGTVVLPKSVSESRIESNFNIIDLSDEDGEELNNLHKVKGIKRFVSPNWDPIDVYGED